MPGWPGHVAGQHVDVRLTADDGYQAQRAYSIASLARLAAAGGPVRAAITLTRRRPPGWRGGGRRVEAAMLAALGPPPSARPRVYVCGPTPFVERVADLLVDLGQRPEDVRTERFGPGGA